MWPLWNTVWSFLKLKMELSYDLTIPLQGIYPEKTLIWKDTCSPMFIAALFTIAKTWKESKCPSTDKWIKKIQYIYNGIVLIHTKRNEIKPFSETWINLEIIILSELSQSSKLSLVWLFVIPWTVAYQAPLSIGFSRQEYWSGLQFLSTGDLPDPGIRPGSPSLQEESLPSEPPGKPN